MGSDATDSDRDGSAAVPVDAIPAPVLGYDVRDERPVITETNDPFDSAFDPVSTGTAVRRWLQDEVGVDGSRTDAVCSSLADGGRIDLELEVGPENGEGSTTEYRLRTFEASRNDGGPAEYVLLTERRSEHFDDAEIDRIASVISHDLRNPLDVANAHLRAARETGDDEHFDEVRRSHDRMGQIIQDVLTLARGRNALSIDADVDIGAVATDAWATVDTRGASFTLEDDLPRADADPDRLQRLFENLFRNSIEHAYPTTDGETPVEAGPNATDADHPLHVRVGSKGSGFFVADNGTGIPDEDRGRVFDPGYSSNETGGGTGLGLTIVKEIADAHDWDITITTDRLGGARFEFRPLPGNEDS